MRHLKRHQEVFLTAKSRHVKNYAVIPLGQNKAFASGEAASCNEAVDVLEISNETTTHCCVVQLTVGNTEHKRGARTVERAI